MSIKDEVFYWVKVDTDFLFYNEGKALLSIYGSDYLVIYLLICGMVAEQNGILAIKVGDKIIPYDTNDIKRECKWFDEDKIANAVDLYKKIGLICVDENGIMYIPDFEDRIGCETYWAKRKRATRGNKKEQQINISDKIVCIGKENEENGYVYLVKLDKHYKIGISINPNDRLKEFTLLPYPLEEICIERVKGYKTIEQELHTIFERKNVRGEWFELNEEDVLFIKNYLYQRKI